MNVDLDSGRAFVHTGGVDLDASLRTVLLIHGAGQDHTLFRYLTRALAHRGFAAAAPDLPGHGRTPGPPLASIPAMAGWVLGLLDALAVEHSVLVGHSMGSLVAIEAAAARPDTVAGLVLTGAGDSMPIHPDLQAAADASESLAGDLITGWTHTGDSRFGGHAQAGMWTRGVTLRLLERDLDSLGSDLRACGRYAPAERLSLVRSPVTIVAGGADSMTRARQARALAAVCPNALLTELPGVGHDLLVERPEVVLGAIQEIDERAS